MFSFVCSVRSLFGKGRAINNVLRSQNIKPEEAIYVGDEARDIEAAKKNKVKIIAVSWGFSSRKILEEYVPDLLINDPEELIGALEKIQSQG